MRDHHGGYIDWEAYHENQRMKRRNRLNPERVDVRAAIRERQGLLVGVLRCGRWAADARAVPGPQGHALDYEVLRAFEQYDEVDPRNRLVAAELERRWKRSGYRTAKDKRWNQTRVFIIRNRYSIPDSALDADVLHSDAAARYCGVSVMAIRRLVAIGVPKCQQLVPYAPWKIRRSDLDSPALRSILERLKRTGRREIVGDGSHSQQRLLTEN